MWASFRNADATRSKECLLSISLPIAPFHDPCDVLVVGGGINGVGIARDLAGRGLKVVLCEKDDLGAHTSSSSTKLIHGGLRYLEHGEFSLVRKALQEREVLLRSAPHIMWPLRFVMPHDPSMRPAWLIRAGLFLYDHLARRELLPGSSGVDLRRHVAGGPLKPQFRAGFMYSDGWVDDARLVVLAAIDAARLGATVLRGWRCAELRREGAVWSATLQDAGGKTLCVGSRAVVNAAGPWAAQFQSVQAPLAPAPTLRLVRGSHIVVPKLFEHGHAYIFQNADRRIIFAIPYESDFTLIGTTDVDHTGEVGQAHADDREVAYLCEQASCYFARPVVPSDVVWRYAGVRPLLDDGAEASAVTRDYQLDMDAGAHGAAPLLTVWGGKITTFRRLAEDAADMLCRALGRATRRWTRDALLPGGDLSAWTPRTRRPDHDFARFEEALAKRHPQWAPELRHRLARCHGGRIDLVLEGQGLGEEVVPGLHAGELHYFHRHEWARAADDVLWRRTKLGLRLDAHERERVAAWCLQHWPPPG